MFDPNEIFVIARTHLRAGLNTANSGTLYSGTLCVLPACGHVVWRRFGLLRYALRTLVLGHQRSA